MRILFLFLTFSALSWAPKDNAKGLQNSAPCTFEMTIDQLISKNLTFQCAEVMDNKAFKIHNFRIKFMGHPSIAISGDSLNDEAKEIAKNLQVGDYVSIFGLQNLIVNGNKQDYNSLNIKIVE